MFRTNPGMHLAVQGRPAWQPATRGRQEAREAHRQGPGPQQQPDFAPADIGNGQGAPEVHFLFYGGVMTIKINRKGTDNLKVFKGDMGSFKFWNNQIADHLCESTGRWRELLKKTQESDGPITKEYLKDIHVGFGDNAWTIAEESEKV